MEIIKQYGTPLKISYLPRISEQIQKAKQMFNISMARHDYSGSYTYCYCTKSSHFSFVLEEALKNDIHIETSSAYDIPIVRSLHENNSLDKKRFVVCNGFKRPEYTKQIVDLLNDGFENTIPVLDNIDEFDEYKNSVKGDFNVGIRIATEEIPNFNFYSSRLGINPSKILDFYKSEIKPHPKAKLKMLHFFINTGIRDNAYYWNELLKCLKVYTSLKKICPSLNSLNIGGGFPIKNSLAFDFDYEYIIDEIINQIKLSCEEEGVDVPNIFTEFGSFTVGESGGVIYEVLYQKQQNDREKWNMINSSFITTLPDTWAINKRFIMLPINRWNDSYERVLLGGLTCDSDDYYNSEQHMNAIYLPKYNKDKPLYIGFFNTGAYQETIGGYGGLQHCLIPAPKHVIIDKNEHGIITTRLFREQQKSEELLEILGYDKKPETNTIQNLNTEFQLAHK
jgi:arginine decarboxylase